MMKKEHGGSVEISGGSVYGVALVMPQIARSAGWPRSFTGLAIRSYIHLILNLCVQVLILYQIDLEINVMNYYGGQMHLCNFGRHFDQCPGRSDCVGPGGATYSKYGLHSNYAGWHTNTWVRDTLIGLTPSSEEARIRQEVTPGEYGVEAPLCRIICVFLFVMEIIDDWRDTYSMILLLWHIPTAGGPWLSYSPPTWTTQKPVCDYCRGTGSWGVDPCDICRGTGLGGGGDSGAMSVAEAHLAKRVAKEAFRQCEMDYIRFHVGSMPVRWKLLNVLMIIFPKTIIWLLLLASGFQFLMETAAIQDLIINSLAMAFILQIDELIGSRLCTQATKTIMDKFEVYDLVDCAEEEQRADADVARDWYLADGSWHFYDTTLWLMLVPKRLLVIVVITVICYWLYFWRFCEQTPDGSFISVSLYPPKEIPARVGTWLFRWWFYPSSIETLEVSTWAMPKP